MKVPYDEGLASHIGPESCIYDREADLCLSSKCYLHISSEMFCNDIIKSECDRGHVKKYEYLYR